MKRPLMDHSLQYMWPDNKSSDCIEVLGPTFAGKFLFLASLFLFNAHMAAQQPGRETNNHSRIYKSAIAAPLPNIFTFT